MKWLFATTLLSLVCCAANAEAEKVISVLCKGTKSVTFWPSMNTFREPITTTYLFTFEKHSGNNNASTWVMQRNGESKKYPEEMKKSPLLISFSILVSDHLVLLNDDFANQHVAEQMKETINRLSGDWRYESTKYNKNKEPIEIEVTRSITGTCEAAKPQF